MTETAPDLLARAQSGDVHSFAELCEAHRLKLLRHAFSLCRELQTAEDLAQETFIEAWKNLSRFRGDAQFYTWLCAIILNRYRNSIRRQRPFPFSFFSTAQQEELVDAAANAEDAADLPSVSAEKGERAQLISRLLNRLSPKLRDVLFLRFYVDDSLESIAAALGCSIGTVKSRLFYALEQLREMKELQQILKEDDL